MNNTPVVKLVDDGEGGYDVCRVSMKIKDKLIIINKNNFKLSLDKYDDWVERGLEECVYSLYVLNMEDGNKLLFWVNIMNGGFEYMSDRDLNRVFEYGW